MVLIFVAGPAINNATAAPGEPNDVAITYAKGTDAVAQIYMGIEKDIAINIFIIVPPKLFGITAIADCTLSKFAKNAMTPDNTIPIINGSAISLGSVLNP